MIPIAAIRRLEESDGVRALVMEFVEGRTLAELIAGRPARCGAPVERPSLTEAVNIARQEYAEALEAAHERASSTAISNQPTSSSATTGQ